MPVETPKLSQSNHKYYHYSAHYYRGQLLYWILLLIVFTSLCSLPFINVDVSVQSRGVIKTKHKLSAITCPITAKVIEVKVEENGRVFQGDTLIVLDKDGFNREFRINQQQVVLQETYVNDLDLLIKKSTNRQISSSLYEQERLDYNESIVKLTRKVSKLNNDFKRTSALYHDGVVPLSAFQEDSFKLYEVKDELRSFKTATQARWEADKRNYTLAIHELNSRIESLNYQISQCYITAPFDGNIIEFNGVAEGSFIPENELIARISPEDDLIAECYVSPSDIGLIHKGMDVSFQIDAYNYNQWGLLEGRVADVANDVIYKDGKYVYLIRSQVDQEFMQLKNGVTGPLKKGMSLTGRFVVTQRSLFQLLFDNVDDWLNPKVIKE